MAFFGINFILKKFCPCKKMTNIRYDHYNHDHCWLLDMQGPVDQGRNLRQDDRALGLGNLEAAQREGRGWGQEVKWVSNLHFVFCILRFVFPIFFYFLFCILHFAFCILHFAFCILHFEFKFAFCILHFKFKFPAEIWIA